MAFLIGSGTAILVLSYSDLHNLYANTNAFSAARFRSTRSWRLWAVFWLPIGAAFAHEKAEASM
jgi:hypothetical protein